MKIPQARSGITTTGALGISLIVLVATNFISAWWLMLAVPLVLSAQGSESGGI